MARKSGAKKAKAPEKSAQDRLIDAALALAATEGWRRLSLNDIARAAGLGIDEAYALHGSKHGILNAFRRRVDRTVLAAAAADSNEPWRDRLFDVLMRRFDALQPHRAALRTILRESVGDPAALASAPGLLHSMAWMLEAAGISAAGLRGRLRVHVLTVLYGSVMRVFLGDESADLTTTMASLDRRLRHAESLFGGRGTNAS